MRDKMKLVNLMTGLISIFAILAITPAAFADCRGCCSGHKGVTCRDGETMCVDGTPLLADCKDRGCNKCGSPPSPISLKNKLSTPSKSKRPYSRKPVSSSKVIKKCECGGILLLTNMGGCPCNIQ